MNANDPELVRQLSDCARAAWYAGSPTCGYSPDGWERMARIAIGRWRSYERRHKRATPSNTARMEDLARGLRDAFEDDAKLAGPLIEDYRHLAGLMADVLDKES